MRRCAAFLLVTSMVACGEPTSSLSPTDSDAPTGDASLGPVSAQSEMVRVAVHNDAPGWSLMSIDSIPKHHTPFWFIEFGIPGRRGVQTVEEHSPLAPSTVSTTTFYAPSGALRGTEAWLHAAAVYTGAVAAGQQAPLPRAIKCGPAAPAATTVAHQFSVDFHVTVETKGTLVYLRCR